jgi:hypothetical protein
MTLILSVWLALVFPAESTGFLYAQRKPYDRGNCFHWQGCRGESIGAMWIHAPEFCAALGGRSWLDESTGRCYNLPPGPRGLLGL